MDWSRAFLCLSVSFIPELLEELGLNLERVLCHCRLPLNGTFENPAINGNKMAGEDNCEVGRQQVTRSCNLVAKAGKMFQAKKWLELYHDSYGNHVNSVTVFFVVTMVYVNKKT
jgi:hypothetical protein